MMETLASAVLAGFAVAVGAFDLRHRTIPNWLTIGGAVVGVGLVALGQGAVWQAVGGVGAALGVGVLLWRLGVLGAGDAKFMAAIGAWAGWDRLPAAGLGMLAGGALFALAWSARQGLLRATLTSTATMVGLAVGSGVRVPPAVGGSAAGKFPYGVGLGLGALVWWFWAGGQLP
jgi:prepilin peptidase CpaA